MTIPVPISLPRVSLDPSPQFPSVHGSKTGRIWALIVSKVWQAVRFLFLTVLGIVLFATNSTLFPIGFLFGAICPEKATPIIERINNYWKRQPWGVRLVEGVASFLAVQITGAFASLYFAVNLGIYTTRF